MNFSKWQEFFYAATCTSHATCLTSIVNLAAIMSADSHASEHRVAYEGNCSGCIGPDIIACSERLFLSSAIHMNLRMMQNDLQNRVLEYQAERFLIQIPTNLAQMRSFGPNMETNFRAAYDSKGLLRLRRQSFYRSTRVSVLLVGSQWKTSKICISHILKSDKSE